MSTATLELTDEQAAKLGIKGTITWDDLYEKYRRWQAYMAIEEVRTMAEKTGLAHFSEKEIAKFIADDRSENRR